MHCLCWIRQPDSSLRAKELLDAMEGAKVKHGRTLFDGKLGFLDLEGENKLRKKYRELLPNGYNRNEPFDGDFIKWQKKHAKSPEGSIQCSPTTIDNFQHRIGQIVPFATSNEGALLRNLENLRFLARHSALDQLLSSKEEAYAAFKQGARSKNGRLEDSGSFGGSLSRAFTHFSSVFQ